MRFCVCQWLVLDGLVLRPDGCGIKLGEVFVPDIQDVLINLGGRSFLDAERKAFVRAIEFDLSPRGDDWICRTFIAQLHAWLWITEIVCFVSCDKNFK